MCSNAQQMDIVYMSALWQISSNLDNFSISFQLLSAHWQYHGHFNIFSFQRLQCWAMPFVVKAIANSNCNWICIISLHTNHGSHTNPSFSNCRSWVVQVIALSRTLNPKSLGWFVSRNIIWIGSLSLMRFWYIFVAKKH